MYYICLKTFFFCFYIYIEKNRIKLEQIPILFFPFEGKCATDNHHCNIIFIMNQIICEFINGG